MSASRYCSSSGRLPISIWGPSERLAPTTGCATAMWTRPGRASTRNTGTTTSRPAGERCRPARLELLPRRPGHRFKIEETEMKTGKLLAAGALAFALSAGLAHAKIPVPPMDDAAKAKAEETKTKAADTAKKDADQLAMAQDRVVARYKNGEANGGNPATAAKDAEPAVASTKK